MRPEPHPAHADTEQAVPRTETAPGRPASASTTPALAPKRLLGHFEIVRPLGAGGMGEVYLATDLALDRPVAIKVLPEALDANPARRERLVREARAQARVVHPNVAHIYFIGEDDGRLYFAMEHVVGETLAARLATGPVPVDEALAIVRQVALGLREAQRHGFTHRDVKPSNLMIDSHGVVKVLDFGLAAGDPEAAIGGAVEQTSLAGTPLYMAPEQARGEPVDLRTDIYALGATLYHLVSGKPPFVSDTVEGLLSMHSEAERPTVPRKHVARTQVAAVDALIGRMMAPQPGDRFASYDELLRAVELASVSQARPAGLWVRAMATVVDFVLIAICATLSIFAVRMIVDSPGDGIDLGTVLFPLYGIYAAVATKRYGRTLGQSLFELVVVDIDQQSRPGWRRTLVRSIAVIALPLVAMLAEALAALVGHEPDGIGDMLVVLLTIANVVLLLWAAARSAGKRTPWDRLSHTMVRYAR